MRTLNIYYSDAFECTPSRLMHSRGVWSRVAQVHIPSTRYNVEVHLASERDYSTAPSPPPASDSSDLSNTTVEVHLSPGLPVTANSLIFEYAAFHNDAATEDDDDDEDGDDYDQEEYSQHTHYHLVGGGGAAVPGGAKNGKRKTKKRLCWRCNALMPHGSTTCEHCKQNGNQCSRCLFINLSDEEMFLCTNCGSSNLNHMSFSVIARLVPVVNFLLRTSGPPPPSYATSILSLPQLVCQPCPR